MKNNLLQVIIDSNIGKNTIINTESVITENVSDKL